MAQQHKSLRRKSIRHKSLRHKNRTTLKRGGGKGTTSQFVKAEKTSKGMLQTGFEDRRKDSGYAFGEDELNRMTEQSRMTEQRRQKQAIKSRL